MNPQDYDIREQYIRFNRMFFNGELPEDLRLGFANLSSVTKNGALGVFRYYRSANPAADSIIELDTRYDYTQAGYDGILLHEMVHAYMFLVKGDTRGTLTGDDSHHTEFWEMLNRVAEEARGFGITIPPTEDASHMSEHAKGKRRSSMTLAVFRLKNDTPGFFRYSAMLPSVFDEIVTNFQFKVATSLDPMTAIKTGKERLTATRPHSGTRFYNEFIDKLRQFSSVDWEQGVEIFRTSDSELALHLESVGVTLSQRFLEDKYWVTDTEGVKFEGWERVPRAKKTENKWRKKVYTVYYNPTIVGLIERAKRSAIGSAVVKADGVYVNGEKIHGPAPKTGAPTPNDVAGGDFRRTREGVPLAHSINLSTLPSGFMDSPVGETFWAVYLHNNGTIQNDEFQHGTLGDENQRPIKLILYVYSGQLGEGANRWMQHIIAGDLFNLLPDEIRKPRATRYAQVAMEYVTKDDYGIYSRLRMNVLWSALERALKLPDGSFHETFRTKGAIGNMNDNIIWGGMRDTIRGAHIDQLRKVYNALMKGASPLFTVRSGGASVGRLDADSFMEDIFGTAQYGNDPRKMNGLTIYLSMLFNQDPWSDECDRIMDQNAVRRNNLLTSPKEVFESIIATCNKIDEDNMSDPDNKDAVKITDFAKYIVRQSAAGPQEMREGSERYLDTIDTAKNNVNSDKGILSAKRIIKLIEALNRVTQYGMRGQKEIALVGGTQTGAVMWFGNHMPDDGDPRLSTDYLWKRLEASYFLTELFGDDNPFLTSTKLPGDSDYRNASVALYILGDYYHQMPTVYRDAAMDMWERIVDTAENGPRSVVKTANNTVPDLVKMAGPRPSSDKDYERKSYDQMTRTEKLGVLVDAGMTISEINKFNLDGPFSELGRYPKQAFGGYKWLDGRFDIISRDQVAEAVKNLDTIPERYLSDWNKLWTNWKEGDTVPANQFGSDSESATFERWRDILLNRFKSRMENVNQMIRQNNRSMNFPYDEVANAELSPQAEAVLMAWVKLGALSEGILKKDFLLYYVDPMVVGDQDELERLLIQLGVSEYTRTEMGKKDVVYLTERGKAWLKQYLDSRRQERQEEDKRVYTSFDVTNIKIGVRAEWVMDAFHRGESVIYLQDVYGRTTGVHQTEIPEQLKVLVDAGLIKRTRDAPNVNEQVWLTGLGKAFVEARARYFEYLRDPDYNLSKAEAKKKGFSPVMQLPQLTPHYFSHMRAEARDLSVNWDDLRIITTEDGKYELFYNIGVMDAAPEDEDSELPPGWTESTPGGMATNKDPLNGGIIDVDGNGRWFIIFNVGHPTIDDIESRKKAFEIFFQTLADIKQKPKDEVPPPKNPEPEQEPDEPEDDDSQEEDTSPERDVKAPKVKIADGKSTLNITIGVNDKTKKLIFVPTEGATGNIIGIVRKREAKPVAAFLNYVFEKELASVTKKIRTKQRKGAARDLAIIANRIRPYLVASGKEATPFPGRLEAIVTKDWGEGLAGQKAFWRFLQGKATTRKAVYHDVDKLAQLAGIEGGRKLRDDEEAALLPFSLGGEESAARKPTVQLKSSFSVNVADLITKKHYPLTKALSEGLRSHHSQLAKTSDVLDDLVTLGVLDNSFKVIVASASKIRFEKLLAGRWKAYGELHFANITKKSDGWHVEVRRNDNPSHVIPIEICSRLDDAKETAERHVIKMDDQLWDMPAYRGRRPEQAAVVDGVYVGVKFDVATQQNVAKWIKDNNIPNPITKFEKMHSTIVRSTKPLSEPWEPVDYTLTGKGLLIRPDTYSFDIFGNKDDKPALVLKYQSDVMDERFDLSQDLGAQWDFPEYHPHITLSYDCGDIDISKLPLPDFPLYITHEYTDVLRTDFAETAETARSGPVIDNINGIGSVPYNHPSEVSYRGIVVQMRPKTFLRLAANLITPRVASSEFLRQAIKDGKGIGSPRLIIDVPNEWFQGDFSKRAKIAGHEGRHRMMQVLDIFGNDPIEVHLFPRAENHQFRARNVDIKQWKEALSEGIVSEHGVFITHPFA